MHSGINSSAFDQGFDHLLACIQMHRKLIDYEESEQKIIESQNSVSRQLGDLVHLVSLDCDCPLEKRVAFLYISELLEINLHRETYKRIQCALQLNRSFSGYELFSGFESRVFDERTPLTFTTPRVLSRNWFLKHVSCSNHYVKKRIAANLIIVSLLADKIEHSLLEVAFKASEYNAYIRRLEYGGYLNKILWIFGGIPLISNLLIPTQIQIGNVNLYSYGSVGCRFLAVAAYYNQVFLRGASNGVVGFPDKIIDVFSEFKRFLGKSQGDFVMSNKFYAILDLHFRSALELNSIGLQEVMGAVYPAMLRTKTGEKAGFETKNWDHLYTRELAVQLNF